MATPTNLRCQVDADDSRRRLGAGSGRTRPGGPRELTNEARPSASRAREGSGRASRRSLIGLDGLNLFLADVQTGVGPFLAVYLAAHQWDEQRVGVALTAGGIAGILAQGPAGALVDRLKSKRALVAAATIALAVGALVLAGFPSFWPVMTAQVVIGGTSSVFVPAICAMSLGLVGHAAFDQRQGRNQTFNAAGNVTAAVSMGLLGYFVSNRSIFLFVLALALPTLLALRFIQPAEIDHELARGGADGDEKKDASPARLRDLFTDRPLLVFLACAVMFHFANAAMLPLLGQLLSKDKGRSSMLFMSACIVTTQLVITLISAGVGRRAGARGRKPLLLVGFAVLPIRGVLYTLTTKPALLVAIQVLDGVGAGIFNVVSVLVIADLTRGKGRFNLTLGAITAAVGAGAALSQVVAGSIVHHVSYRAGFLFLAAVATAAFALLFFAMPETRHEASD